MLQLACLVKRNASIWGRTYSIVLKHSIGRSRLIHKHADETRFQRGEQLLDRWERKVNLKWRSGRTPTDLFLFELHFHSRPLIIFFPPLWTWIVAPLSTRQWQVLLPQWDTPPWSRSGRRKFHLCFAAITLLCLFVCLFVWRCRRPSEATDLFPSSSSERGSMAAHFNGRR